MRIRRGKQFLLVGVISAMAIVVASLFVDEKLGLFSRDAFIEKGELVDRVKVVSPGMVGSSSTQVIKDVTDPDGIQKLIDFANFQFEHIPSKSVDTALTSVSLIRLDFMEGATVKGRFGFNADFRENSDYQKDVYGIGSSFFEFIVNERKWDIGHFKRNAARSEIEELMKLLEITKDNYRLIESSESSIR